MISLPEIEIPLIKLHKKEKKCPLLTFGDRCFPSFFLVSLFSKKCITSLINHDQGNTKDLKYVTIGKLGFHDVANLGVRHSRKEISCNDRIIC